MNARKEKNMMAAYTGFKGEQTVRDILSQIPGELFGSLSGKQLGSIMNAVNTAYHNGKASVGVDVLDDCLWLPTAEDDGKLLPLEMLRKIEISETIESELKSSYGRQSAAQDFNSEGNPLSGSEKLIAQMGNGEGAYYKETTRVKRYILDETERF